MKDITIITGGDNSYQANDVTCVMTKSTCIVYSRYFATLSKNKVYTSLSIIIRNWSYYQEKLI